MKVIRSIWKKIRSLQSSKFEVQASRAFTLIELLVVISILGLIAGLAVPALKNLGKANSAVGASRQLLDGIARARQMAISQRTTVYMVFVPTNFWGNTVWLNNLTPAQLSVATNLVDKQLSGYNFISHGRVGDQPGQHKWHYLSDWDSLPQGTIISPAKFSALNAPLQISQWENDYAGQIDNWISGQSQIYSFQRVSVPFPTETSSSNSMPYIAFDYLGRLISETSGGDSFHDAYIPLAQGSVGYARDPSTKTPVITSAYLTASDITENPPGNDTNISYQVIDINALTGRAALEQFQIK